MFCTTLRSRPAFSPILPALISDARFALKEWNLATHDLATTLSVTKTPQTPASKQARYLRVLLLSSCDVEAGKLQGTMQRLLHFVHLTGGRDAIIIFLLSPSPPGANLRRPSESHHVANKEEAIGLHDFSRLQAAMMDHDTLASAQVVPLDMLEHLPDLLHTYTLRLLSRSPPHRYGQQAETTSFDLLKMCTSKPPMSQQTAYVLSDICPNLKTLAEAYTTPPSDDHQSSQSVDASLTSSLDTGDEKARMLHTARDLIGGEEHNYLVDFWRKEWAIE